MIIVDQVVSEKILQISKHYTENIDTRFLRPIFVGIFSDINLMHNIADLTENSAAFVLQGQRIVDLYNQIFAMGNFIFLIRRDILPNLHNLSQANTQSAGADKVYRVMAFSSLPGNIDILATLLIELFERVVHYDKSHSPKNRPIVNQFQQAQRFYSLVKKET